MNFGTWSIVGGIIGFFATRNWMGAILGAFVGSMFDTANTPTQNKSRTSRANFNNHDFANALLILSAAVMKADGKAMKSELDYVKKFFIRQFGPDLAQQYVLKLRDYIIYNDIPVQNVCYKLANNYSSNNLIQLLHYLIGISHADGEISQPELSVLRTIALHLGIHQKTFESIMAMFLYQQGDFNHDFNQQTNNIRPSRYKIEQAYKILELPQAATESEIKKAYRKLAVKYHPDKVNNLGPEYQQGAKEKFQKVQEAYDLIKKEKGIK